MPTPSDSDHAPLVLASTSPYRATLLRRLGLEFSVCPPSVDEAPVDGERAAALATRLARAKAQSVSRHHAQSLVIGSDQTLAVDGELFGKPGSPQAAARQLRRLSGRTAQFQTAVCVAHAEGGHLLQACVPTRVTFRALTSAEIDAYVVREPAFDCAGSFKGEGLGIALCERMCSDDPTALVGLPLIALCSLLRRAGLNPLAAAGCGHS